VEAFKFTRTSLARVQGPDPDPDTGKVSNQVFYWDSQVKGFGLRVTTSGTMSFVLDTRINGKKRRITIGKYTSDGALTPEKARAQAGKLRYDILTGKDPVAEKKKRNFEAITLSEALAEFLDCRKNLKPNTVSDMHKTLKQVMPDWFSLPLTSISPEMVVKRHAKHGKERSPAKANLAMRYLRSIFNYTMEAYTDPDGQPLLRVNPVNRLQTTRAWFDVKRRTRVIEKEQMKTWLETVINHPVDTPRDYFLLVLFTGLRKTEALTLKWEDVNLNDRFFRVRDTKNGSDHVLPLSEFAYDLLKRRFDRKGEDDQYVFPGKGGEGHYKGPDSAIRTISKAAGFHVSLHDLRRTFATIAESLDIPAYALKALLNHSTASDVTAGYINIDEHRLAEPMEKISQHILLLAGITSQEKHDVDVEVKGVIK
jgi:integrase